MKIKVSIIIPIYNSFAFLDYCLKSVQNQTLKDIEFVLINDGSTDDSESICKVFSNTDKRFNYFYKENGGLSSARNLGISKAKGEYIIFLDSDDFLENNACEILYSIACKNNTDLLNFGYNYIQNDKTHKRNSVLQKNSLIEKSTILKLLKKDTVKNKLLWFSTTYLYNTDFLIDNHLLFNTSVLLGEDSDFNLRCLLSAKNIYSIDNHLYNYVYNYNSLTQTNYKKNLLEKFYSQFLSRIEVHKNFNIHTPPYLLEISRNYIEHSLFELFLNIYKNKKNSKESLNELRTLRRHILFKPCFEHYKVSNSCSSNKKILIFLFEHKFLVILNILLKNKL